MFSPKRDETRPGYEMRKEHIAIGVMILLCLPILAIYVTFFAQAFVAASSRFPTSASCIQLSSWVSTPFRRWARLFAIRWFSPSA